MSPAATDWNGIALAKLTKVLGEENGVRLMRDILSAMNTTELRSAAELRVFAEALMARGGFAGALGGLLSLHATMHDYS